MRLFLIRHPRPAIDAGVCYGALDPPAEPQALQVAIGAAEGALPAGVEAVSSPQARCRALAEALRASGAVGSLTFDARLAEMHFGRWEGRRWDEIPREAIDAWARDPFGWRPPGGETAAEVETRCMAAVGAACSGAAGPRSALAVITHAGPIRLLLARLCGKPRSAALAISVGFGSIAEVDSDPGSLPFRDSR